MSGPSGRSVLSSDLGTIGLADLVRDLESAGDTGKIYTKEFASRLGASRLLGR